MQSISLQKHAGKLSFRMSKHRRVGCVRIDFDQLFTHQLHFLKNFLTGRMIRYDSNTCHRQFRPAPWPPPLWKGMSGLGQNCVTIGSRLTDAAPAKFWDFGASGQRCATFHAKLSRGDRIFCSGIIRECNDASVSTTDRNCDHPASRELSTKFHKSIPLC